jgi:predicted enzyme related to lactoylglutathione lyase
MLRGFATVVFQTDDMAATVRWYTELLGIEPYFTAPGPDGQTAYTEFRVGDSQDEFGFMDARFGRGPRVPGAGEVVYWHVDDIEAAVERLLDMGATVHNPITQRGAGFVTAQVLDPFGNLLGVMYNPHYVETLQPSTTARSATS